MGNRPSASLSLLDIHLAMLDDPRNCCSGAVATEGHRVRELELPVLDLTAARSQISRDALFSRSNATTKKARHLTDFLTSIWGRTQSQWGPFGALATVSVTVSILAGFIVYQEAWQPIPKAADANGVRSKGDVAITVYFEREGVAQALPAGADLHSGDRVRVALESGSPAIHYLGILSESGQLLTDPSQMIDDRIVLTAGQHGAFAGSWELIDPSDGEQLAILSCPLAGPVIDTAEDLLLQLKSAQINETTPQTIHIPCQVKVQKLRD